MCHRLGSMFGINETPKSGQFINNTTGRESVCVFLWPYGVSNPSEIGCPPSCGQLRRVRPFRVTVSTAKLQLSRRHVHCPASIHPCTHRSRRRFDPYALNGSAEEESMKLDRDNTLFRYYCCATITFPCRSPCDGTLPGKSQKTPSSNHSSLLLNDIARVSLFADPF